MHQRGNAREKRFAEEIAPPAVEAAFSRPKRPYKLDCRYVRRDPYTLEPIEERSGGEGQSPVRRKENGFLLSADSPTSFDRPFDSVTRALPFTPERPPNSPLQLSALFAEVAPVEINRRETRGAIGSPQTIKMGSPRGSERESGQATAFSSRTGRVGGCSCKKSHCLKLYCECFASQNGCSADCGCEGCFNRGEFDEIVTAIRREVLGVNPTAFDPKIDGGAHAKGCTCRRNGCQKRYCECHNAGVACSANCRCCDCKNGREGADGDGGRVRRPIAKPRRLSFDLLIERMKLLSRLERIGPPV